MLDGRPPVIRSDGSPERDFLYVDDAVAAYLAIAARARRRERPGARRSTPAASAPHSVREVVELIAAAAGTGVEPEYLGPGTPDGEIDRQYVDSAKLRELTGWAPRGRACRRPAAARSSGTASTPRRAPSASSPSSPDLAASLKRMCGRFTVTAKNSKSIADRFQVELEKALERNRRRRGAGADEGASRGDRERSGPLQRRADSGDPHGPLLAGPRGGCGRASARHG